MPSRSPYQAAMATLRVHTRYEPPHFFPDTSLTSEPSMASCSSKQPIRPSPAQPIILILILILTPTNPPHRDINRSIDGGVYAELIQNRAFYHSSIYPATLDPWQAVGGAALSLRNDTTPLSDALPTDMRVASTKKSAGQIGFANPGWWGIDVAVQTYKGSFWVKGRLRGGVDVLGVVGQKWRLMWAQVFTMARSRRLLFRVSTTRHSPLLRSNLWRRLVNGRVHSLIVRITTEADR